MLDFIFLTCTLGFYFKCAILSRVIHEKLLTGVTRSPMTFFDTNPSGRIVNRFSADVDIMDGQIPRQLLESLWCMIEVLTTFVMVCNLVVKFVVFFLSPYFSHSLGFLRHSKIFNCGLSIAHRVCNFSKDLHDHLKAIEKAVFHQQITYI